MTSEKTLEELVPEVKDKIGILLFKWGINAGERVDDYVHAQMNFQPAWTSHNYEMAVSELNPKKPLRLHGANLVEMGLDQLLIHGGYRAGTYTFPYTRTEYGCIVENVPPEQIHPIKRAWNVLTGQKETRVRRTKKLVPGEEKIVIPTLDQVITVAEKPEDPKVIFYSDLYGYGRGPMSSNNFIFTNQETYDEILSFCRSHPEQIGRLYQALSGAKVDGLGAKYGSKIGFGSLPHWEKNRAPEKVYNLDNKTWGEYLGRRRTVLE